jgi:hypothetical protein
MTTDDDDLDVGHDFQLKRLTRHTAGSGTWVTGTLSGHRFDALVFPEHATNCEWEIDDSRISKLRIQRLADQREVFNWDRGADVDANDDLTKAIVDFLIGDLADYISVLADPRIYDYIDAEPSEGLAARYRQLETRRSPDGTERWLNWVNRCASAGHRRGKALFALGPGGRNGCIWRGRAIRRIATSRLLAARSREGRKSGCI